MIRNEEKNRIYYTNEEGKMIAEIDFPLTQPNEITITHTFVDDSLRGQGMAKRLVEEVLELAKKNGYTLRASCSYARKYFENHPNEFYKS